MRGTEEGSLLVGAHLAIEPANVLAEAHGKHAIALVQNEELHVLQDELLLIEDQVPQTAFKKTSCSLFFSTPLERFFVFLSCDALSFRVLDARG